MAVTLTSAELASAAGVSSEIAQRLLPVAKALVERYAPTAPVEILNEAAIRAAGYLAQQQAHPLRSLSVFNMSFDYSPSMVSALRHSGAMALLSPFKIRRAGVIEESD
ncbi:MAG: hypothetical protein F4093_09675 [Gammaproteobacteria bacterium]|nr:hypothetical protein [Nitrospira sp. SB0666_bin_27]MYF25507.1 hypothetical protein [Nitrospira sp. SB0678_bin_10]MYJ52905.1 hypothetical protein [Gammaproteobacteria bacterium]